MTTNVSHPSVAAMRTTMIGMGISIVLVVVKLLAGIFGHSYALIADATETGTDILSSSLLWLGLRVAMIPADQKHPYGHGKAEPLAAAMIALLLICASVWIAAHAIHFIMTPHRLPEAFTLWVLLAVMLIKEVLYRYVRRIGNELGSHAVLADAHHHRADALTSLAAFIGIAASLCLGQGYEAADDWAAMVAAGIVFYNGLTLLRPAFEEIMDAAPTNDITLQVRALAEAVDGVKFLEKCHVRKMGFDYYADLHVHVLPALTVEEGHNIAHAVKDAVLSAELRVRDVLVHIEPFHAQ